jgi:WD40 repeat protein
VAASCNTPDLGINTVNVWDTNTGSILGPFKEDSIKIARLNSSGSFTADNEFLIVSCIDKTTRFFDIQTGMLLFSLNGQGPFKLFPDRKKIALSTGDGTLQIWNIKDGSLAGECKGNPKGIYSLEISPEGKEILVTYDDNTLILWDVDSCHKLTTFVSEVPILDISINTTGTIIARDSGNNLSILSLKNSNRFPFIPDSGQLFGSFLFYSLMIIFCWWLLHHSHWWLFFVIPAGGFSVFSIITIIGSLLYGRRKCTKCGRTVYTLKKDTPVAEKGT